VIFCHKPYYNPNYINLNKKSPSDIWSNPKKLYKLYKLYKAKQTNSKEHREKIRNQILKLLNYKYLLIGRKYLNLKK
jgi:hypothetical protein